MPTNPFAGTWSLVSAGTRAASGEVTHPFGNATGYLIYSQDGYMAVAIMPANRANIAISDIGSELWKRSLPPLTRTSHTAAHIK